MEKQACLSTQLKHDIYNVIEEVYGFSKQMTPNKYYIYSKIRKEISLAMGKSRPIGIIEYMRGIKRLDAIKVELKEKINGNKSG